jgi:hypothetical protein
MKIIPKLVQGLNKFNKRYPYIKTMNGDRETPLDKETALSIIKKLHDDYISRLPKGLDDIELFKPKIKKLFEDRIKVLMYGAEIYINLIYDNNMTVGKGLSRTLETGESNSYDTWHYGLIKHLKDIEGVLSEAQRAVLNPEKYI